MKLTAHLLRLATFATLAIGSAHAQTAETFRPALIESLASTYSYSSRSDLNRGPAKVGDASVQHFDFSLSGRTPLADTTSLILGLAYTRHDLDFSAGVPLPDSLQELSLTVGLQHRINTAWSLAVFARPGFYGDFENLGRDSLNLPLLAVARYVANPNLTWTFGLNVNPFARRLVLPAAGVKWQFAPAWTFELGFPKTGFTYEVRRGLSFNAGVSVQGGTYRITRSLGVPAPGVARLAHTFLDYREIRVGLGVKTALTPKLFATLDAGLMADRKFDYFDRSYRLNGDSGLYVAAALATRF